MSELGHKRKRDKKSKKEKKQKREREVSDDSEEELIEELEAPEEVNPIEEITIKPEVAKPKNLEDIVAKHKAKAADDEAKEAEKNADAASFDG
jgi:hypothetical protein